ncbi:MAG TPA: hypothetical protein VIR34_05830 [Gemmatimonadaceae bacterium]|jgi:hypothetical protein
MTDDSIPHFLPCRGHTVRVAARLALICVAALVVFACREATEPVRGECSTARGEFGIYGCARIEGQITDQRGGPVAGAYVAAYPADSLRECWCNGAGPRTGTDGRSNFTVDRLGPVADAPQPDTITLVVRASLPADTVVYSDSVRVLVEFVPVGAVPPPATAALTLTLP